MPRTARFVIPDISVHVVQRGHNRNGCFFQEIDYLAYLDDLQAFAARFHCSVHAYCLMTNHVHLLITPHTADACAQLMKNVGQRHVQRINARLQRTGSLWEGRFYSCPVPSERYALACYRYIELNPVGAGMVRHPDEYRWSSYRVNAQGRSHGFVTPIPRISRWAAIGRRALTHMSASSTVRSSNL
jgi:putative transposase